MTTNIPKRSDGDSPVIGVLMEQFKGTQVARLASAMTLRVSWFVLVNIWIFSADEYEVLASGFARRFFKAVVAQESVWVGFHFV